MMKELIHQKDIALINTYTPNNMDSKYIKSKLIELKGKIDSSTTIVCDFSAPFSVIAETSQKLKQEIEDLNSINELDLTDIHRAFT